MTGEKEVRLAEDVTFPREDDEHEFIARLWATRRIAWLINETRLRGKSDELKDEITALARKHGIVTPYTAWLIVEDEERRQINTAARTLRPTARNTDALAYSRDSFERLSIDQTGADAALSARYGGGGARAKTVAPAADAPAYDERFLRRYGLTNPARVPAQRGATATAVARRPTPTAAAGSRAGEPLDLPSDLAKQSRVVAGKTFFLADDQWVDAEIQKHSETKETNIAFNSDEYFELMRKDSRISKWLTLGAKIRFYLDGMIYEIE